MLDVYKRQLVGEAKALTIPDLLSFRFPSKWIRLISLTIIIIAYIPAMIAQIKGCGTLVQSVFPNMDFKYAALVGLTIVCVYVMIGGMKAVAYTCLLYTSTIRWTALQMTAQ